MSKKTIFLWLFLIFLPAALGCDQARSNFEKINFGMSRTEVEKILGKPAKVDASGGTPIAYWIYGGKQLVVQYNKDKVQVKQIGPVAAAAQTKVKSALAK